MTIHLIHFRGIAPRALILDAVYLYRALSGQSYTLQVGAIMAWGVNKNRKDQLCGAVAGNIVLPSRWCK